MGRSKRFIRSLALLCTLCFSGYACEGCLGKQLVKHTDALAYLPIPIADVSKEELDAEGVRYYVDDAAGLYYVEKSCPRKVSDDVLRTVFTPVAFVGDLVVLVGLVSVGMAVAYAR